MGLDKRERGITKSEDAAWEIRGRTSFKCFNQLCNLPPALQKSAFLPASFARPNSSLPTSAASRSSWLAVPSDSGFTSDAW